MKYQHSFSGLKMGAARHFLSTIINSTLIDYALWLAPEALSILDLNLSDAARVELQQSYPKSHCQHLSFSDMESGHFYQADISIDLFIANIARTYPLDLKLFFNDVRRVVHREGVILFATFDSSTLDVVKTQVHVDASEIFVDESVPKQILKKIPNVQYIIFKKELFDLNESQKICAYIFVLAPLKMLEPLLRLRNFSDSEGAPQIFNTQPTEDSESAVHEGAEEGAESAEVEDDNEKEVHEAEYEHAESTHETTDAEDENIEMNADDTQELAEHEPKEKETKEGSEEINTEKDEHEDKEAFDKEDNELIEAPETEHVDEHEQEESEHEGEEENEDEKDESEGESTVESGVETKEVTEEKAELHSEKSAMHHEVNHQDIHDTHKTHDAMHEAVDDIKLAQLNKKMETHRQQLETHLLALNKNLNSSAEIMRDLRSGRLSQQEQQTKRAALRQHFTQHQTLLNAYQNLQQSHAGLLNQFINAQEHTLRVGTMPSKINIQKHQDVSAKHKEEAKKHEELLETLRL